MNNLSGSVADEQTLSPLPGAVVKVTDSSGVIKLTLTDAQGGFTLQDLAPGKCKIEVFKEGYYLPDPFERKLSPKTRQLEIYLLPGSPLHLNATDFSNLTKAAYLISSENRQELGLDMSLDVYVQDPLVAEQVKTENALLATRAEWNPIQSIYVTCEPGMVDGPTSSRIAVVDFDTDKNHLEPPVAWDEQKRYFSFEYKGKKVRITQEHKDEPQFHQLNVWAVVQSILNMYEQAGILGRPAPWAFEGSRITLAPHAGIKRNASYNRTKKSINFYYFDSGGKRVYTCPLPRYHCPRDRTCHPGRHAPALPRAYFRPDRRIPRVRCRSHSHHGSLAQQ